LPDIHSRVSPSGYEAALLCPGRPLATEKYPRTSNEAADEGTDAHELAAFCLTAGVTPQRMVGEKLPLGHTVTQEMADFVTLYVDHVNALRGQQYVEQWVDMDNWIGEEGGGTADAIVREGCALHVVDLKYGLRYPVSAENNPQLMGYALGALDKFDPDNEITHICMHIVQPRNGGISMAMLTVEELREWGNVVLRPGIIRTQSVDAPRIPGDKQCLWCAHKGACPELAAWSANAAFAEFGDAGTGLALLSETPLQMSVLPPAPTTLTGEQISMILARSSLIAAWLKAVDAEAIRRMGEQQEVPGYKLVAGKKGNRAWTDGAEEQIAAVLLGNYGLARESIYRMDLLSPTQMLKLPEVKANPGLLDSFIHQAEGGVSLAPVSDKRPALALDTRADAVFSDF
jgi:hypothetical protein